MNKFIISSASTTLFSALLLTAGCSSGGDSGGGGAAVPANAIVLDATNAEPTVASSVTTVNTFDLALPAGVETTPTMGLLAALELIKPQLESMRNTAKNSGVDLVYGTNIDEGGACSGTSDGGTFSFVGHETSTSDSGSGTFTDCDFGFGFILNGNIAYSGTWNNTTGDYSDNVTGTLSIETQTGGNNPIFSFSGIDFAENGNDSTPGAETYTVTKATFAVDFNGGNGFLVSLSAPIVESSGGYDSCPESGTILITGGNGSTAEGIYNGDGSMTIKANGIVIEPTAPCYF